MGQLAFISIKWGSTSFNFCFHFKKSFLENTASHFVELCLKSHLNKQITLFSWSFSILITITRSNWCHETVIFPNLGISPTLIPVYFCFDGYFFFYELKLVRNQSLNIKSLSLYRYKRLPHYLMFLQSK